MSKNSSLAFAAALAILFLAAPASRAQAIAQFDLPAQSLAASLRAVGSQTSTNVLFDPPLVEGMSAPGVTGELTAEEAFRKLLTGTGLQYRFLDDKTVMVIPAAEAATAAAAAKRISNVNAPAVATMRLAQARPGPADGQAGRPETAAAEGGDSAEEVVVKAFRGHTATKTDVLLTQTPQAISVITADEISSRGALSLQEALRYSSGVRTEINGSDLRIDYFASRGFAATRYLDGMVAATSHNSTRTEVYMLERVEVLRGPSSVLYGQGTAGGIVNSMSKRPRNQTAAEMTAEFGSYDRKQVQFDLTGPLNGAGTVSARLVGVLRDAGNQFDFGRDDRVAIAPSLRFQPGERTDIVLLGLYQDDKAGSNFPYLPISVTLDAPPGRRVRDDLFLGEPSFNIHHRKQTSGSLLLQHHFTDALTFDGGVRYSHASGLTAGLYGDMWNGVENPFIDADRSLLPRYRYDAAFRTDILTSDNRIQWRLGGQGFEHNLLGGVDYSHVSYDTASAYATGAAPINIYEPVYGGSIIDAPMSPFAEQITKQIGFYLQDHIRFGERATVVLGARRDKVTTTRGSRSDQVDHASTFRVGATYEVVKGVTPYVSYAESFIPTIGVNFYGESFKPQEGIQYEAGVKWQPDRNTLLTISAFDLRGTNRPQTDPENGQNTIQSGEVKSRGVEFEAIRRLPDDYSVTLGLNHMNAEVTKATRPLEIGFPIGAAAPKFQASVWGDKTFMIGGMKARAGLGVRRMSETQAAAIFAGAVDRIESPGFTLVDALLSVDLRQSTLALSVTNLLDDHYYGSCSIRTACSVGYRRNMMARWTYRFF